MNRAAVSRVFRTLSSADDYAYVFEVPEMQAAWVGSRTARVAIRRRHGYRVEPEGIEIAAPPTEPAFTALREILDPRRPVFFVISPDLVRSSVDETLPLALFLQPDREAQVARDGSAVLHSFVAGEASGQSIPAASKGGEGILQSRPGQRRLAVPDDWVSEPDDSFLGRLTRAVELLHNLDGKAILTRWYERSVDPRLDPFRLYEIYSSLEPGCGASHFVKLADDAVSMGCSPENVFELDGDDLIFDVIAATRGVSRDPQKDARWRSELLTDPKEIREHEMALARYRQRLEVLCLPESIGRPVHRQVRELRHVRHLHSRVIGRLRQPVDFLGMLESCFPPLTSYPAELIPLTDTVDLPMRYYGGMVGHVEAGWRTARCYLNLRAVLMRGSTLHTIGGVGVIAQSEPAREALEVRNKLAAVLEAADLWANEGVEGR